MIPLELQGLNVDNPVVERIKNAKATVTPR
jgi:hypothetical protein